MIAWFYSDPVRIGFASGVTRGDQNFYRGPKSFRGDQKHRTGRRPVPSCPPWKSTQLWKKSWPKRFITKKVGAFWNRPTKNFHWKLSCKIVISKNFEIFRSQIFSFSYNFQWKSRWKFRDFSIAKNVHRRFSKWPNFVFPWRIFANPKTKMSSMTR